MKNALWVLNSMTHHQLANSGDHWLNLSLGVGAIFGVLAVIGGGICTARYGRRGCLSVTAELVQSSQLTAILVRPRIKAVGVFRIRFSYTRVTVEVVAYDENGRYLSSSSPMMKENVFGDSFVEGGEELLTSVLIPVTHPDVTTIGWFARIEVKAPPRFLRGRFSTFSFAKSAYWYDTVFVPITSPTS